MSQTAKEIKVLCIDDHADTLEILRYILEMHGYEVRTAATATEGFEILEQFTPRLVISDVCLPDEDGVTLMLRMRQHEAYRQGKMRTIALSAHCTERDRRVALTAGFARFIEKPFDEAMLIQAVNSVLDRDEFAAA
jgi:two-component system, OmpR family, response regulator